jgi:hypothetical protein
MSNVAIAGVFFSFIALLALFPVLKPNAAARLSAQYFKWSMKIFGFDCDVRVTPRAVKICRVWNIFMLCVFAVAFLAIALTAK